MPNDASTAAFAASAETIRARLERLQTNAADYFGANPDHIGPPHIVRLGSVNYLLGEALRQLEAPNNHPVSIWSHK